MTTPRHTARRTLRAGWARVRWWARELSGESAYDKYLLRHTRLHPDVEPLGERAFWRARADEAERHPVPRCC